jgi:hypothetical protein
MEAVRGYSEEAGYDFPARSWTPPSQATGSHKSFIGSHLRLPLHPTAQPNSATLGGETAIP